MKPYALAKFMHEQYEKLARENDWETQKKTRVKFSRLPKENKRTMIGLAEEVLHFVPSKCPIWQCGGEMRADEDITLPGPDAWQMPYLRCTNCKAIYKFQGFRKRRAKK